MSKKTSDSKSPEARKARREARAKKASKGKK